MTFVLEVERGTLIHRGLRLRNPSCCGSGGVTTGPMERASLWATPRRPIPKSRLFNAFAVFGRDPAYVLMLEPVRIRPPDRDLTPGRAPVYLSRII